MTADGWVKLHRKMTEWEWADDPNMVALWLRILLSASYKPEKWRGIDLNAGQVIFGRKEWSEKTGISEQSLRTCIARLKSTNEITIESTNKYTILTIVNWEEYQQHDAELTSKSTSNLTNEQPATNQQSTTYKEIKNLRNKEEDISCRLPEGQTPSLELDVSDSDSEGEAAPEGTPPPAPPAKPKPKKADVPPVTPAYGFPEFPNWQECYEYFRDVWNARAAKHGLAQCQLLNDKRQKAIRKLYVNECGAFAEHFADAVDTMLRDPFFTGNNDRGWKADFDYILRPEPFLKQLEKGRL